MFISTIIPITFIILCGICAYNCIRYIITERNYRPSLYMGKDNPGVNTTLLSSDLLPLIERPYNQAIADPTPDTNEETEEQEWEFIEDRDNQLLKEAENVVEQIQDTVNHIASNPPNPEEVFSKINAIVREYSIFENTEYFDAINSFVAVCVERDCNIKYSKEELQALWN